ncbi:DUF3172 domain-containing protein [Nostoc sp. C117]|uniref:DUF3172 domain-containing protein n=1 Tax=Nostoc sp. C117 TaxID=3349875 RepID=UPI00370DB54F
MYSYAAQGKFFYFNTILVAIVGVTVLPTIILGVNVTTVTTFSPKNVSSCNYTYNTTSNADICVHYGTSEIFTDTCVFICHLKFLESLCYVIAYGTLDIFSITSFR